jgi:zinc protease
MQEEVEKIRTEPVTEAELEKARNQLLKNIVFSCLTVEEKASLLGHAAVIEGNIATVNTQVARINAVTAADVQRVAQKYLGAERRMDVTVERNLLGTLLSGFKKEEDAKITAEPETVAPPPGRNGLKRPDDFPKEPPLAAATKADVSPKFAEKTLANGLKVKVVSKHGVPFVAMQLGLTCGGWTEPKPGLANMALEMLTKGTAKHTEGEFAKAMETYGISIYGSASLDSSSVGANCVTQQCDRAIALLAEAALSPTFTEDEFKKLRVQTRSSLALMAAMAEYAADKELRKQLYGAHPYARTNTGEPADIDALKTEDLHAWWSQIARPDMATLIFSGDIELDKAVALAEAAFGGWKAEGAKPEFKLPEIPTAAATHIVLVDRPGSVQSQIRAGQLGLMRRDPDFFAAMVTSGYFGGAFGSRLNEVIRVKKGLTYGAHGGFSAKRFAGEFQVSTFSKTETTAPAVQAVLDEIARLRVEGPTVIELADQKSYMQGSFARDRETPQAVAGDLWMLETNGLKPDYYDQMMTAVAALTDADCLKLAQKAVDPAKLVIVVVGNAAQIKADLEKIAPVTVVGAAEVKRDDVKLPKP